MINIRVKEDRDSWENITKILHSAYRKHLEEEGLEYYAARQTVAETIQRNENNTILIVTDDEELIGCVSVQIAEKSTYKRLKDKKMLMLSQFAVLPEYQSKGIGSRVLDYVEKFARDNNVDYIMLDTSEDAVSLCQWYLKKGYSILDFTSWSNTNYYSTVFIKRICSEKDIKGNIILRKAVCKMKYTRSGKKKIAYRIFNKIKRVFKAKIKK